eukprot:CAMPEP_0173407090 /NCGR_PEP_ID=MMETSP1356-20130122/66253_1 /TAXON_ID=77927 ORGANISM="Hemiselmis virescens, Strain PCC157" /NCGR_SAMPLE_ID=MMETSP1356 /ASSEMBLY_ACC=CAM_ASM_000847 /LENGTH=383 /DNA_ID=CAMNT_0014368193 /DNA_START=32 /DNA_END=1180 /DNA_ORIENTATION=-
MSMFWIGGVFFLALQDGIHKALLQATCMVLCFLVHAALPLSLPRLEKLSHRIGVRSWSDKRAWLFVAGTHLAVMCSWSLLSSKISDGRVRWVTAYLCCIWHFKLQQSFQCITLLDPPPPLPAHANERMVKARSHLKARAKGIMSSPPLLRASIQMWAHSCDDLRPVHWGRLTQQLFQDVAKWGSFLLLLFVSVSYVEHEMNTDIRGHLPGVMCLIHFLMVYPSISLLFWGCQLILWLPTGCVSHNTAGDFPLISGSMREFWSRRYNQVISELCRTVIFYPLASRGWSAASATFVVFFCTGLLHAIPTALVSATYLEVFGQFFFFVLHWAVCAAESVYAPKSLSVLRTFLLFVAIYPVFGVSGIYSMTRDDVGYTVSFSRSTWV